MKKISGLVLLIIFAVSSSFIGWNAPVTGSNASSVTNYYYYQGQKYYLEHKTDMIFVKLKSEISRTEFENMISSYGTIPADYSFEKNDVRQFIKLTGALDNTSINTIISALRSNNSVLTASPVFGVKEGLGNRNTLIGCEDNIILQFKPNFSRQQVDQYLKGKNMTILQQLELTGGLSYLVQIPTGTSKTSIEYANEVYENGVVNYADPGFFYTNLLQLVPNDQFFPMQWSAINTGTNIPVTGTGTANNDMGLDSAWNQTTGIQQCRISVVDSGMDTTHPDLSANVVNGYNFNYYANTYGGIDDFGHGASCAGIIAALGNNTIGISGVAPNAKVFSAKIFNSGGSTTTAAITNAMIGVRTFGNCWISSNSWGGGSPVSAADNAILDGTTLGRNGKGIVWVFATGNGNGALSWPSTLTTVISVGGVSPCNQRKSPSSCDNENWWGANYGTGLDIVAPCVKIYATVQGGGYTNSFNGTSSATPNTSGVAGLLLSKDSSQTWDTVRARINRTAQKRGSYSYTSAGPLANLGNTWNNEMGYGIVNANLALLAVGPPPANDVAAGPFLSFPGSFTVNTAYNIRSRISNIGTNAQTNVPCRFFVNGTIVGSTVTIPSLPAGGNDSVTFSWTPTVVGNYTLKIATGLAVDNNRSNDTVTAVVTVLPSGVVNTQTTICRNNVNLVIPDNSTVSDNMVVNIANSFNIVDVNVRIDTIIHTWDADLSISLIKGATNVNIISGVGGSGDNFIGTVLNDSAATPIASGTAPFTGSFIPSSPLAPFVGQAVNGTWTLSISDGATGDTGLLKAWCLQITYQTVVGGIQTIEIPNYFSLAQNYPNPFNPNTSIKYSVPTPSNVVLKIYDVLGKEVVTLVNEVKQPGFHTVDFNASELASGIYFYRIDAGEFTSVKRMVLVK
ncbi:MAG: S8 family serine peptidase [Ignavibacteria bacterium]|nr:S8 family serine peptidase [Ignavibacteria bacterium]